MDKPEMERGDAVVKNKLISEERYMERLRTDKRARRKKGTYARIFTEYRSRIFKFASRNFYSEFLAAREAAINYRHYFGHL